MRGLARRKPDEMLVVHRPTGTPGPGREAAPPHEIEALPADVAGVAAVLRGAADPERRAQLLAGVQGRFGNAFAARVVEAIRTGDVPASGDNPEEPHQ